MPNFRYVEAEYEDYPSYFSGFDVFLSLSEIEGGHRSARIPINSWR